METKNPSNETTSLTKTNGTAAEVLPVHRENSPFTTMRHLAEEMDRTFNEWSFGRGWLTPLFGRDPLVKRMEEFGKDLYLPDIEVVEKDGTMTVRTDLPGIRKEDVTIEITNNSLVIKGERHREEEEAHEGYYRSERSYGKFYRSIPFRDGIEADDAQASFKDGVLEVTLKTKKNGRTVEIQ